MKTYIATLQIDDDMEIVGDIEATANYTYKDNGTNYGCSESVIFERKINMTDKEAIKNLNMIRIAFVDPVTKEQRKIINDTFDVAIKALNKNVTGG